MPRQIEATVTKAIFAAAIAQDAGFSYSVPIPGAIGGAFGASRCRIKGIAIIAEESTIDWEIWLWSSATHPSNRNLDPWLGYWLFNKALQVTMTADPSTSYRNYIPDLDIPYRDDDTESAANTGAAKNGRIHMTLIPRTAAHVINKEIVIKFFCEPEVGWA